MRAAVLNAFFSCLGSCSGTKAMSKTGNEILINMHALGCHLRFLAKALLAELTGAWADCSRRAGPPSPSTAAERHTQALAGIYRPLAAHRGAARRGQRYLIVGLSLSYLSTFYIHLRINFMYILRTFYLLFILSALIKHSYFYGIVVKHPNCEINNKYMF